MNLGLSQSQSPRMDVLRKHHNESTEIYNRTQPIINEQIHNDTMKYIKNVQGTDTKKARAPKKKPRSNNNSKTNGQVVNAIQPASIQSPHIQPNQQQLQRQQQPTAVPAPLPQQQLPQQIYKHQQPATNSMYNSASLMSMQAQQPAATHYHQQPQQQLYVQHHQVQVRPVTQQNHFELGNNNRYIIQRDQQNYGHQQQLQAYGAPHQSHSLQNGHHHGYHPTYSTTSLPNDLDLNLQRLDVEVDVDYIIKHEVSVEGKLDFNQDLLLKLDGHCQPVHYQHHPHHQ